jgi:hypothetical protein
MSKLPPERHKPRKAWSVAEVDEHDRTGLLPETDEYRDYVRKVHQDAGLDPPEIAAEPKALEELTAEDHFERIRRGE